MAEGIENAKPDTCSTATREPVIPIEVYKQLHETCRHGLGLYIAWFTFFITVNFVALGWLAKANNDQHNLPFVIFVVVIAIAFIIFIALGVRSALTVKAHIQAAKTELNKMKQVAAEVDPEATLPAKLYVRNLHLMMAALIVLSLVWLIVVFSLLCQALIHTGRHIATDIATLS
jgi:hypothetical protein